MGISASVAPFFPARFRVVDFMAEEAVKPTKPRRKPWKRPKWISSAGMSAVAILIAAVSCIGTFGNFQVNRSNRQDTQLQASQVQTNAQIDSRIDNKLGSVNKDLEARKDADISLNKDIDSFKTSLQEGLNATRIDIGKVGDVARATQQAVSEIKGQIQRLDKDVDLLLQRQLKGFADLPTPALAAQVPNIHFLYEMAAQRKVQIPSDTNNLIRAKLASINQTVSEFWPLASDVVSRASLDEIGKQIPVIGTLKGMYSNNYFVGLRVIVDGSIFTGNIFQNCIIEYQGGETTVKGNVFVNCLFVFTARETPSPGGQTLLMTILGASDLRSVKQPS